MMVTLAGIYIQVAVNLAGQNKLTAENAQIMAVN